jgi:hypothetical protein
MNATTANPLIVDGVEVLPGDEPGWFYYLPKVQPELSPAGEPTLLLLKQADGGVLQFGAQFAAPEATLDKIRTALSADASAPIRLQPAPLNARTARLLLRLPAGEQELGRAQPAGLPPNTALFRVSLNSEQTAAVAAALAGKTGELRVVYDFERPVAAGAQVAIQGDATGASRALPAGASEEQARAWVRQAVADGRLRQTVTTHGDPADSIIESAIAAAETKAAQLVLAQQSSAFAPTAERADRIRGEIRLEAPRSLSDSRAGDVGGWFAGGQKARVMTVSAPPPAASGGAPIRVRLGFEAKATPLAFIELRGGAPQPVILRGPQWAPVTLNRSAALQLAVHYTTGAPVFLRPIEAPGPECALALEDLGVARIVVDASARKSAGARKLAVTVRYLRAGEEWDRRPVRFQFGDWIEEWFQVTGASGLNGTLEYQWQETGPDGAETAGGPLTTDHPVIQIQ